MVNTIKDIFFVDLQLYLMQKLSLLLGFHHELPDLVSAQAQMRVIFSSCSVFG